MFELWHKRHLPLKRQLVNDHDSCAMNPKYSRLFVQLANTRQRRWVVGALLLILVLYFTFLSQPSPDLLSWFKLKHVSQAQTLPPVDSVVEIDLDQPPTYERLQKWEIDLPQHNLDLPFPEGRTGRYVLFKNQVVGLGWNNELNEV